MQPRARVVSDRGRCVAVCHPHDHRSTVVARRGHPRRTKSGLMRAARGSEVHIRCAFNLFPGQGSLYTVSRLGNPVRLGV